MEISKSKRTWIIIGAVLMTATVQLSSAGLNNTMYAILSGMNGLQYYALLATLSSLGMAIMCVIGGRIGDMIGRRAVILAGAVLSLASAIVMGLAQSLSVFIVARAVLSFGIGTFPGNAFVVAADVSDAKQYPKVAALLTATLMVATFLGSTIAGYLVDAGLIPAAIIYPGVVGLIGAVIAAAKMDKKPTTDGVRGKVDGIGMVLLAVFMLSLCLSLNQGANLGFGNPIIICGFVVAVVSLLALLKVEKKAEVPVIPLYLFKNKKYTGVIIAGAFITFYEVVMASYVPVSGQALMGLSASITGYFSLPRTIIAIVLAAPAAAWVVKNQAKNSAIGLAAAGLLAAVAFLGMIFVGAGSPVALPFILIGITGFTEALKGAFQTSGYQPARAEGLRRRYRHDDRNWHASHDHSAEHCWPRIHRRLRSEHGQCTQIRIHRDRLLRTHRRSNNRLCNQGQQIQELSSNTWRCGVCIADIAPQKHTQ